jgi:uncharacterized membrane protein YjjP (DUF1212 family)
MSCILAVLASMSFCRLSGGPATTASTSVAWAQASCCIQLETSRQCTTCLFVLCVCAGFQPRYHCKRAMAATQDLVDLAKSKGLSPATLAQAWAASRWG